MLETLIFFSIVFFATIIFTIAQTAVLILYGIKINSVQIGYGKPLKTIKMKSFDLIFSWIPGGAVSHDIEQFNSRSLYVRWLIILVGPLSFLLSSALFLTFPISIIEFVKGYSQLFNLIFHPSSYGQNLIHSMVLFFNTNSYFDSFGVLSAKMATFNMLPVPFVAGGRIIMEALPISIKAKMAIHNSFLIVMLLVMAIIAYAFYLYIF